MNRELLQTKVDGFEKIKEEIDFKIKKIKGSQEILEVLKLLELKKKTEEELEKANFDLIGYCIEKGKII